MKQQLEDIKQRALAALDGAASRARRASLPPF